jgi:hypothetical protein
VAAARNTKNAADNKNILKRGTIMDEKKEISWDAFVSPPL